MWFIMSKEIVLQIEHKKVGLKAPFAEIEKVVRKLCGK
jgi:hypothetical protein